MKTKTSNEVDSATKVEYDFSHGVRGKYAKAYAEGRTAILLAPEVTRRGYPKHAVLPLAVREKSGRSAKA